MKKTIGIISILFNLLFLRAEQNIEKLFLSANQKYNEKQYPEAIKEYLTIINTGQKTDILFYNLGNSYYKNKENTKAILYYEKALKINPKNTDAEKNRSLARLKVEDKIDPLSEIILLKIWKKFKQVFSANQWAIGSLMLFWAFFILATYALFSKISKNKRISFLFCILLFVLCGLCGCIAYDRYAYQSSSNEAIIFSPIAALKVSPDSNSKTSINLHEGTKLFIEDHIGAWYMVRLEDGKVGWLEKNNFEAY